MVHYRAIGFIILIFVFSFVVPIQWIEGTPLCLIHWLTGFSCPGCGLTRSFVHFFHGNIKQSFLSHILGPVIIVWFIYYLYRHSLNLRGKPAPAIELNQKFKKIFGFTFVILLFGQWFFKLFFEIKDKFLHS